MKNGHRLINPAKQPLKISYSNQQLSKIKTGDNERKDIENKKIEEVAFFDVSLKSFEDK